MTEIFPYNPAMWSYGVAAIVFSIFALRILIGWRGGPSATVLLFATIASTAWAGFIWASLAFEVSLLWQIGGVLDAIRIGAWLAFLTLIIEGATRFPRNGRITARMLRYLAVPTCLLVSAVFFHQSPPWLEAEAPSHRLAGFFVSLGVSVYGLGLSEQLYRLTPENRRWGVKPLVIGLTGMFAFDLLICSGAILYHQTDSAMWSARGAANAIIIFFVGVAVARNKSWTVDVFVSREVVHQSTALLIAGVYLLVVAAAAYWVQFFGGNWGGTLSVALVFAALLGLTALMLSGSLRARLRVLISKNLFSYRYDYRQEWLNFTRLLDTTQHGENLYQQVVRALADLVESTGGAVWIGSQGSYSEVATVNIPNVRHAEPLTSPLVSFLARTNWVIRVDECAAFPMRYPNLTLPDWLTELDSAWLVVPLLSGTDLIGFVVLAKPRTAIDINWEVRDLLKTASRQAASYIAHVRAKEALTETEQFDAFNRMSAFVVHDLKNLVAQLALVLKNSERHSGNPAFQQDVLETVEHAVGRMTQLMLQLRTGTTPMEKPRPVDLAIVIQRIISMRSKQFPILERGVEAGLRAMTHEDRIERVIGHILQNAIDAVDPGGGQVAIRAYSENDFAVVEISDNGAGMTDAFIREQLFHPFQTTKPHGMGIGMYESFQYLSGIGGRISVVSSQGAGTEVRLFVPLGHATVDTSEKRLQMV